MKIKSYKKTSFIFSLTILAILVIPVTTLAQGPGAPPATPVDGGLSLLLAAGGIYGIKKVRDYKRKN